MKNVGLAGFLGLVGVVGLGTVASCSTPKRDAPKACGGQLAIGKANILGSSLPPKTLALTFDDGPGVRAGELSSYLKEQGIHATFFINGFRLAIDGHGPNTQILKQIHDDGHLIGNHTQTHRSLTGRATATPRPTEAQVIGEISDTDAILSPFVRKRHFVFRPPYGDFDDQAFTIVDDSPMKKYVGPVYWDIGDAMGPHQAADWDCWQRGSDGIVLSVRQCGDLYLEQIETVGRGIVLMHDPYFIDGDPKKGGTVDMVKYVVPILKARGYTFVNVDEVPAIQSLFPPDPDADAGPVDGGDTDSGSSAIPHDDGGTRPQTRDPSFDADANPSRSDAGDNSDPCPPSPQGKSDKSIDGFYE